MSTTTTFPDGSVLVSSALTTKQMDAVMQGLFCDCLGLATADPKRAYTVRTEWAATGQPAWGRTDDVLFLRCTEQPDEYNLVRNEDLGAASGGMVNTLTEYTRVWRVFLVFAGPNGYDNARLVKSAMFLDFAHDTLQTSGLYIHPDIEAPRRVPELKGGQWWERTDLALMFNEDVRETMEVPTVQTTQVNVYTPKGLALTVTA